MSSPGEPLQNQRRSLRRRRKGLSPLLQRRAAERLLPKLRSQLRRRPARRLGLFWPTDGELGPPLWMGLRRLRRFLPRGAVPYLPVVQANRGAQGRMRFQRWSGGVRPGVWGIPRPATGPSLAAHRLDAVLVPTVAADGAGRRMGRGGGHYDRAFAPRPGRRSPRLIGMAWPFQRLPSLCANPWDLRLHQLLTPAGPIPPTLATSIGAPQP